LRRGLIAFAVAFLGCPQAAHADSDGYFCTGPGYLAFETRFSEQPARHLLHVVRFSAKTGIVRAQPIPLEDFQVHGMICGPAVVGLQGWDAVHVVDLSTPATPAVTKRQGAYDPATATAARNLGLWARETVLDLDADGAPGMFQLWIAKVSRPVAGGVEHYIVSDVLERVSRRDVGRSLRVFSGIFRETID
jgi:hypothetical protein